MFYPSTAVFSNFACSFFLLFHFSIFFPPRPLHNGRAGGAVPKGAPSGTGRVPHATCGAGDPGEVHDQKIAEGQTAEQRVCRAPKSSQQ